MTDVVVQRRAEVLDLRLADVHFPSTDPEFEERAEVTEEEEDPVADEPGTANRHDQRPHPQLRARHHTPHRRCRSRHAYPLPRSCTRAGVVDRPSVERVHAHACTTEANTILETDARRVAV